MIYLVSRQQENGEIATVGTQDQTIVRGYKSRKTAMRYGIIPYLRGKAGRVEVHGGGNIYGTPIEVFTIPAKA